MPRKLYIYEHCPFCVKAEAIFGLKTLPVERIVLLNDDEATPVRMVGRKQVPILEEDGRFIPESMDIVAHIDAIGTSVLTGKTNPAIGEWIRKTSAPLYRLFLPRAAAAPLPEFATTTARAYFIRNKEASSGAFGDILANSQAEIEFLNHALTELAHAICSPDAVNGVLSVDDIHLFAHLHSMSIIHGIIYPSVVEAYRQALSRRADVPLLDALSA
ncbi:glutaredoxin 2 [Neoasaia chiangmaiensis NBRC 101099]|uniref:Glutaredoxin n=1 Tax=Neoasaia chiangmaiensis TaxID=320497 RepID=A0A1U9KRD3_9PROT|nr:glutaredoxin 2 [Neoasaia chiangmaiensis]AQS88424.1 glutaredoxin [Neoasaia chiangmaiensis]GBR39278.1 glutaredoxin 2 [Neoasaia chiangmaiensis NBRC 101099]GEN14504.1 glutaredoxin 2 [Neoasaia chiangmaiensis]